MSDALLQALREAIEPANVSIDRDTTTLLAHDALHPERLPNNTGLVPPLCVVSPQHTQDVAAAVRVANTYRIPVIPVGGGSGLMGGAASLRPGIVLDLRGLKEIHIRPDDRMADVGAGVTMNELNQTAAPYNLMCGHDPWTVAVATVGGTIATNSLGYLGGKYGAMGQQVLGLEAVLPTGEVIQTRAVEKSSTGPALHRLFVGAEGCFGIVTRATLRLFPRPQERILEGWVFRDFGSGFAAINALFAVGLRPGLLEYGDDAPTPENDPPATLFVSYEGPRRVARAEAHEAAEIYQHHQGRLLPEHDVQDFWNQRHALGDAYANARATSQSWRRQRPAMDYLHVALPPSAVLRYRRRSLDLLARHGLHAEQTGLWGYAGLFSMLYSGVDIQSLAALHHELLTLCQDMQGSMEYCHGVGIRLASLMPREHGAGLDVLRRLKQSLDPHNILNPDKLALSEVDT